MKAFIIGVWATGSGRPATTRDRRRWHRLQFLVDADDPDPRIVPKIAGVGDECAAQHRLGALDRAGIAAVRCGGGASEAANIVAARVQMVGPRAGEKLDQ